MLWEQEEQSATLWRATYIYLKERIMPLTQRIICDKCGIEIKKMEYCYEVVLNKCQHNPDKSFNCYFTIGDGITCNTSYARKYYCYECISGSDLRLLS